MLNKTIQRFVDKFVKEVEDGNAAIFAGAGLSIPAGFVNWKELLRAIAEDLELDVDKETDLVTLAQFHLNAHNNNRSELTRAILGEFSRHGEVTENHKILARLPISTYWTTNYDKLIENALEGTGKVVDTKYTVSQLAYTRPKRDALVYKLHGDVDHPDKTILTRDDYEAYHVNFQPFINALSGDLIEKTFLFIGFSFTDPNLEYVLSRIRSSFGQDQRKHYCLLKKIEREPDENVEDFKYRSRRHDYVITDLKNYNIHALEMEDYAQITEILSLIEQKFKRKTVHISGAAHEYGHWGRDVSEQFLSKMSKNLVQRKYKIVTGMGLGVGSAVISGALNQIYMKQRTILHDEIIMRPFPQEIADPSQLMAVWEAYRQDMANYAGITIIVFGNKFHDGKTIPSSGVRREFDIAIEKKHAVIPIGATGYMAKELWSEVLNNFDQYFPKSKPEQLEIFRNLGDESLDVDIIISELLKFIKELA